jgi:PAS domain S-box-containing protein
MTEIERLQQEIDFLKQEKVAYEETQHRFTTVFELSRLGNKIIDQDLTILQVNQSLVTMLGYENKDDIIGTRIFNYAPADRREDWRFLQQKLWANLTPSFSLETCLLRKDGSLIWCQVTSILIPENGKRLGYTILEDVTEQHNLRLQREEFISVASHELKTPITSLKVTLQLMNQIINVKPEMPTELVKFSQNAQRHVTKLINLVEDLLNTTKIEQGQLALNKTIFTVAEMIDDCCDHIRLAGEYEIICQGDRSLKVFADQFKIDQVMVNLVNNAVKYAPKSKEIIVKVAHLDKATRVSITDRGNGIPENQIKQLFDRFFRVKEQAAKTSGLGLGLFICAEIIRRHGGDIGVESEVGQGSTFWFTLPDAEDQNKI